MLRTQELKYNNHLSTLKKCEHCIIYINNKIGIVRHALIKKVLSFRGWGGFKMKKLISIISIVILSLIVISCIYQNYNQNLKNENQELKDKMAKLEKSVDYYKEKELRQNQLIIDYVETKDKVRFIEKENKLLALPQDDSKIFRDIQKNTLAKVIDKGIVEGVPWIYIQIPVYDSLCNNKGWIKENDTFLYTEDKIKLVQSDVAIKAGAEVYKTFKFEDIKKTIPVKLVAEDSGRLEEKVNGYCRISQAGGVNVWVKESSVIYPAINTNLF